MYEVKRGIVVVNGVEMDAFAREIDGEVSMFTAEAGTTGLVGCDKREGGARAYVSLNGLGDFFTEVEKDEETGIPVGVGIAVCGDEAVVGLLKSLEFMTQVLREQLLETNE